MPNHLTILGIFHTAIGIIAILIAFLALLRYGKINPDTKSGQFYIVLTIITCLTSFPIMKTGHFTAGHYVAIVILVLLPIGIYARNFRLFGRAAEYIQIFAMSTTLALSMIPTVVETLTRVPISKPLAAGPDDPLVKMGTLILAVLYASGVIYQFVKVWRKKKIGQMPNTVNFG